jgi:hypothetical protein
MAISVNEKDLSWYYRQRTTGPLVVYVPGLATWGPENEPTLCDSTNFVETFGPRPVSDSSAQDISYNLATSYIKAGYQVLFHRIKLDSTAKASVSLNDGNETVADQAVITFTAAYSGSFGNSLKLKVTKDATVIIPGTSNKAGRYYIIVYNTDGDVLDSVTVDTLDPSSQYYYDAEDLSKYIQVTVNTNWNETAYTTITPSADYLALTGGVDGVQTSTSLYAQAVAKMKTKDSANKYTFIEGLDDPYLYTYDIVTCGGFNEYSSDSNPTISAIYDIDAMFKGLADMYKRCIYLIDGGVNWSHTVLFNYVGLFNSSSCACYGPWGYQQFLSTGNTKLLPGSYTFLLAWMNSILNGNPVWVSPAGVKRATLGSWYRKPKYEIDKATLEEWQGQEFSTSKSHKVNPIMRLRDYGYVIYGDDTTLKPAPDGKTSALQSLSTRVLSNLIKNRAFEISLSLQFDQMANELYVQFRTLLGQYLDELKYQNAISGYSISPANGETVSYTSINERKVPVIIRISPVLSVKDFDITLEIHQAGITFNDEGNAVEGVIE